MLTAICITRSDVDTPNIHIPVSHSLRTQFQKTVSYAHLQGQVSYLTPVCLQRHELDTRELNSGQRGIPHAEHLDRLQLQLHSD